MGRRIFGYPPSWMGAVFLVIGLCVAGCRRIEPAEAAGEGSISQEERRRYVASSVEIGCMARRETDPAVIAAAAHESFRRHQFEEGRHLLELVGRLEPDPQIRDAIQEGLKACR